MKANTLRQRLIENFQNFAEKCEACAKTVVGFIGSISKEHNQAKNPTKVEVFRQYKERHKIKTRFSLLHHIKGIMGIKYQCSSHSAAANRRRIRRVRRKCRSVFNLRSELIPSDE